MAVPQRFTIDGTIVVDAALSVKHTSRVTLTKHPIEEGADPVDHARVEPESITLEGVFSNYALDKDDRNTRGSHERYVSGGYAADQMAKLRALKNATRAVVVRSARREYSNMMLTSLDENEAYKDGDAVIFAATFEEVRFVKTESFRFSRVAPPSKIEEKPKKKKDKAKQSPEPSEHLTIAKRINNGIGDPAADISRGFSSVAGYLGL